MFRPLAFTKTLAIGFSSILAITLVPVLMVLFIRGSGLRPRPTNPISRFFQALYVPVIRLVPAIIARSRSPSNLAVRAADAPAALHDRQRVHAAAVRRLDALHADRAARNVDHGGDAAAAGAGPDICAAFPKSRASSARSGASDSATDNTPMDMVDTTVMLKPREQWPAGHDLRELIQRDGREAAISGLSEHLDDAGPEPARHGADRHQDAGRA